MSQNNIPRTRAENWRNALGLGVDPAATASEPIAAPITYTGRIVQQDASAAGLPQICAQERAFYGLVPRICQEARALYINLNEPAPFRPNQRRYSWEHNADRILPPYLRDLDNFDASQMRPDEASRAREILSSLKNAICVRKDPDDVEQAVRMILEYGLRPDIDLRIAIHLYNKAVALSPQLARQTALDIVAFVRLKMVHHLDQGDFQKANDILKSGVLYASDAREYFEKRKEFWLDRPGMSQEDFSNNKHVFEAEILDYFSFCVDQNKPSMASGLTQRFQLSVNVFDLCRRHIKAGEFSKAEATLSLLAGGPHHAIAHEELQLALLQKFNTLINLNGYHPTDRVNLAAAEAFLAQLQGPNRAVAANNLFRVCIGATPYSNKKDLPRAYQLLQHLPDADRKYGAKQLFHALVKESKELFQLDQRDLADHALRQAIALLDDGLLQDLAPQALVEEFQKSLADNDTQQMVFWLSAPPFPAAEIENARAQLFKAYIAGGKHRKAYTLLEQISAPTRAQIGNDIVALFNAALVQVEHISICANMLKQDLIEDHAGLHARQLCVKHLERRMFPLVGELINNGALKGRTQEMLVLLFDAISQLDHDVIAHYKREMLGSFASLIVDNNWDSVAFDIIRDEINDIILRRIALREAVAIGSKREGSELVGGAGKDIVTAITNRESPLMPSSLADMAASYIDHDPSALRNASAPVDVLPPEILD